MHKFINLLLVTILGLLNTLQAQDYAQYVNPFVGTGGHGHTFPGATLPFGMVQLSPDTRIDGSWDGCSGYHYSDSVIYGFSHTHLSGTGVSDYGDIMLMPMVNQRGFDQHNYAAGFSHDKEKAEAGYYEVRLANQINVQLTASKRAGFHRYTFPKGEAHVILDLHHRDFLLDGAIDIINNKEVAVKRISRAWAEEQYAYAYIQFSEKYSTNFNEDSSKVIFSFPKLNKNRELLVKVGFSLVSTAGAQKNLMREIDHWDFEKTKKQARAAWNNELAKIKVKDSDKEKLKVFYTALYHTMIHPNTANDVDGNYRGMDKQIYQVASGDNYYTVFSLWDTFRAAHPLYTLIDRKRTLEYIRTFLLMYQHGGRLPVWELAANETDCMIGYHSVSVIVDAFNKGINSFDQHLALEAMQKSANWNHLGLPEYKMHGHLTIDDEHESISKTLEYAYDDWCIAQFAQALGHEDIYATYMKRAQSWKNILDPETALMRPKKNASWLPEFDPKEVNNHFTEGNSWQYSFFVPHDIYSMIELMGGKEKFESLLDELFTTDNATTGRNQVDITGLIGQYAHGNEPSHHMAYLYNYVGKPHKTQERVAQIMEDFYTSEPDGLIGNEDCGQMSAWYVLSAMGFYSVTPGSNYFIIGAPYVEQASIQLENGKKFKIIAQNLSKQNRYVQKIMLNGVPYNQSSYLTYESIMQGGEMVFYMGDQPSEQTNYELPPKEKTIDAITIVPFIEANNRSFVDSLLVSIKHPFGNNTIYYSFSDTLQTEAIIKYEKPFYIHKSRMVYALAVDEEGNTSQTVKARFYKKPNNYSVRIHSSYNPQYTAGGPEGLLDGIRGDENWRKGDWQGYQGQDFEAIVDLKEIKDINSLEIGLLRDVRSWIMEPRSVRIAISTDGVHFEQLAEAGMQEFDDVNRTETFAYQFDFSSNKVDTRYIKVMIENYGTLPEWHQGAGHEAFIFIDEIVVE